MHGKEGGREEAGGGREGGRRVEGRCFGLQRGSNPFAQNRAKGVPRRLARCHFQLLQIRKPGHRFRQFRGLIVALLSQNSFRQQKISGRFVIIFIAFQGSEISKKKYQNFQFQNEKQKKTLIFTHFSH